MKHQTTILAAVAAITTTAGLTAVDLRDYEGDVDILLHHAAATGTTPSIAFKLQHSDDNSTFSDVTGGAFTAVTNAAGGLQRKEIRADGLKRYVRLHATVSGTTPSVYAGAVVIGSKKYGNA